MITALLHPTPHTKIMLITSHRDAMVEELGQCLAPYEGLMDLSLFRGEHQEISHPTLHKIVTLNDYHALAGGIPRDYACVIVYDVLDQHASPLKFLKHIYRTLLNACEIIIVQKNGSMPIGEVESLLDQVDFRAINTMDDLLEGYEVTVAKKMHMWGNGL